MRSNQLIVHMSMHKFAVICNVLFAKSVTDVQRKVLGTHDVLSLDTDDCDCLVHFK
jgi:hypothetical protein